MIWLAGLLVAYGIVLFAVAWFSIHPYRIPFYISPGSLGAPQEEVEFASADGTTIRGWWVPSRDSACVAVFAHGYLMNRCEMTPEAHFLWELGFSCLLIDFRAHGRSSGRISTMGQTEARDVAAAVRFAKSREPEAKVVLLGSSMGSAAAALAVAAEPSLADALILDSCYSKMSSAILGWWRFLGGPILSTLLAPTALIAWPLTGVNPFRVDVARSLRQIDCPVLLLHGSRDNLALPDQAARNLAAARNGAVVWFDGCGHSEGRWLHSKEYRAALVDFLTEHGFMERSSPKAAAASM